MQLPDCYGPPALRSKSLRCWNRLGRPWMSFVAQFLRSIRFRQILLCKYVTNGSNQRKLILRFHLPSDYLFRSFLIRAVDTFLRAARRKIEILHVQNRPLLPFQSTGISAPGASSVSLPKGTG